MDYAACGVPNIEIKISDTAAAAMNRLHADGIEMGDKLRTMTDTQRTSTTHADVTEPHFPAIGETVDRINPLAVQETWGSIERIRKAKKITQGAVSQRMGWSSRNTYRDCFTCKSGHYPSDEQIDRLCNILDVTRDQVGGYFKGDYMRSLFHIALSWDERELIACYERLTESEQAAIRLLVRSLADGNFAKDFTETVIARDFPEQYRETYPTGNRADWS